MEIKVGQVWEHTQLCEKFVITVAGDNYIHCVYENGWTRNLKPMFVNHSWNECHKLITDKYVGDWRSAISSTEFKGE